MEAVAILEATVETADPSEEAEETGHIPGTNPNQSNSIQEQKMPEIQFQNHTAVGCCGQ